MAGETYKLYAVDFFDISRGTAIACKPNKTANLKVPAKVEVQLDGITAGHFEVTWLPLMKYLSPEPTEGRLIAIETSDKLDLAKLRAGKCVLIYQNSEGL